MRYQCSTCGQGMSENLLERIGDRWVCKNKLACRQRMGNTIRPSTHPTRPIQFDDITSGLGIGGKGSDDYNINTEHEGPHIPTGKPRRNGGGQLWEPCPRCGEEPVHLDCGYCDRHCQC